MKKARFSFLAVMTALGIAFGGHALCAQTAHDAIAEDQSEMFPFVISYDAPDNVSSMAHILSAPAGKDGFIRADENGNFVNDAGIIRFNATDGEGPQKFNTGGEVSLWVSSNRGTSWKKVR